jgi:hypothetical protein
VPATGKVQEDGAAVRKVEEDGGRQRLRRFD